MHPFQWRRDFGLYFLALSSVTNLSERFTRVHEVFWPLPIAAEDLGSILQHLNVVENTNFEKIKASFPVKKSFWPVFSLILECDKPKGRIYEYPQSILTIPFEDKGLILLHIRSCWKHNFLKKKANFPVKKSFCCVFSRFIECDGPQ